MSKHLLFDCYLKERQYQKPTRTKTRPAEGVTALVTITTSEGYS